MAEMVIINGVRYNPRDTQRLAEARERDLVEVARAAPVRNKARKAPAPIVSEPEPGEPAAEAA